jgi:hypothetical protein
MNDLIWKTKQFLRKIFPIALIVGALYWGYSLYRQGTFRHGVKYAITSILHRLPYFGSRFSHYGGGYSGSTAYSGRSYHRHGRGHRRHHRRHHRR